MKSVISLGQAHEVFLKLGSAGLDAILAQRIITVEGLAGNIVDLIRGNSGFQPSESQKTARDIMGRNFFWAEEAMLHFGVIPTVEQLATLAEVPYTVETLRECKDTYVLVAVFPISILEIKEKSPKNFYDQSWYTSESVASQCGEAAEWRLVRKTAVSDSFSKNWAEQQVLLGEDEEVPDVRVMTYAVIGHFLVTGERLFPDKYVRTASLGSDGRHVCAGGFGSGGFSLDGYWGGARGGDVGLASSRKFQTIETSNP